MKKNHHQKVEEENQKLYNVNSIVIRTKLKSCKTQKKNSKAPASLLTGIFVTNPSIWYGKE